MDPQVLTFVMLLVGFLLLTAELFLPSGGIIGVMCAAAFVASAYFANRAWATTNPLYWHIYLSVMVVLIPVTIYVIYYLLTKTSFGNRVLLTAPSIEEVTPYQEEQSRLQSLVGSRGQSLNLMTPGGLVEVNGERLHAIGQNMVIEAGTPIEIVGIKGSRVIVRIVTEDSAPPEPQEQPIIAEQEESIEEPLKGDSDVIDPFLPPEQA